MVLRCISSHDDYDDDDVHLTTGYLGGNPHVHPDICTRELHRTGAPRRYSTGILTVDTYQGQTPRLQTPPRVDPEKAPGRETR